MEPTRRSDAINHMSAYRNDSIISYLLVGRIVQASMESFDEQVMLVVRGATPLSAAATPHSVMRAAAEL